ncbi:MAG: bifunctional methylenetetrahydrofolate dehydrogenase/methenyltetrahydrofolate cyclohydrolase [Candidatus Ancillula trichonymphae]|jgi:methylenetetrahydrofolate dehydrogenase (NADP+)/methenyltetrahydrofolate cyclohydrolase|nr:bifunctional methylenetetrahydrofolate dehydrogenase/methenyltetrahydrofolate cyclohydrolase [Candidatus Ancillula trichonymphae]
MGEILDGENLASLMKSKQNVRVEELRKQGVNLGLGTVLVGQDAGSLKYVAGKHRDCGEVGIESIRVDLPASSSEVEIVDAVEALNQNPNCTAFIVQLPLPRGVDTNRVLELVSPKKDADGLHPENLGKLLLDVNAVSNTPLPCTCSGIIKLIIHYLGDDFLDGKHVVVLGRGITVGRSIGLLLTNRKVNATVTLCHTGTRNLPEILKAADVVVAAVGKAHFVQKEWVKPGAVLLDVGVSRTENGKISGDIAPDAVDAAGWYSPNPGGVGPMTRTMLLENIIKLGTHQH